MSDNVEQAARELLRLQAELEDLEARIKEQKAILVDAVEVGGTVEIDGAPMFRVTQKKDFRLDLAEKILPAEVITAATVNQPDKALLDTRDALHTAFAIIVNARNCLGDGDRDPLLAAQWHEAAQRFMDDYNTHLDVYTGHQVGGGAA